MKFSNKDILLLLGIVVAVIIALTTLVYRESTSLPKTTKNFLIPDKHMILPSTLLKKVADHIGI